MGCSVMQSQYPDITCLNTETTEIGEIVCLDPGNRGVVLGYVWDNTVSVEDDAGSVKYVLLGHSISGKRFMGRHFSDVFEEVYQSASSIAVNAGLPPIDRDWALQYVAGAGGKSTPYAVLMALKYAHGRGLAVMWAYELYLRRIIDYAKLRSAWKKMKWYPDKRRLYRYLVGSSAWKRFPGKLIVTVKASSIPDDVVYPYR